MATTWYVSGSGNDSTGDGLSDATAYRLPSKALSVASAGDTINIKRGATYSGTCTVSLNNLTIQAYGTVTDARPILVNPSSYGMQISANVTGTTLISLDHNGSVNHGLLLNTGTTGTATDCYFRNNTGATTDGAIVAASASGSFTFYDCVFSNNGNDGVAAFGTYVITCYRCISFGHTSSGASDGFTNHDRSVMRCWFCESYSNTRGVSLTSDNGGGSSWCVGCYIHDNTAESYVTTSSGGSAACVNPDFVIGCLIVDPNNPAASRGICSFTGSNKGYFWNNIVYNGNAHATNLAYSLNATATAAQSTYQMSAANNLFLLGSSVTDKAYHVRISTDTTGNVEAVKAMKYNYYDDVGGVSRFFNGTTRSFTTWKTYPDSSGNAFDNVPAGSSYFASFSQGKPVSSKGMARVTMSNAGLRMKGTALDSAITALGLNYDLYGHVIQGATPDIGCVQFCSALRTHDPAE